VHTTLTCINDFEQPAIENRVDLSTFVKNFMLFMQQVTKDRTAQNEQPFSCPELAG
jgi:hypothetical protein